MEIIHTGGITPGLLSAPAKIKRACSEVLDANSVNDIASIMHTTTAILVTAIRMYSIDGADTGPLAIDVGINGSINSIAAGVVMGITVDDDVDTIAITTAAVAADKTLVAHVLTADGAASEVQILIEYEEID